MVTGRRRMLRKIFLVFFPPQFSPIFVIFPFFFWVSLLSGEIRIFACVCGRRIWTPTDAAIAFGRIS